MTNAPVSRVQVTAIDGQRSSRRPDRLVTEEPLEIRVAAPGTAPRPLAVTMRTPGSDFELVAGWLFSEGLVGRADELASISYCLQGEGEQQLNVVTATYRRPVDLPAPRAFAGTSACGVCGKASLEAVAARCAPVTSDLVVRSEVVGALPERLRAAQRVFGETGGLHAAARFDADGRLLDIREDVGRHNALDKVLGRAFLDGRLPLSRDVVFVSGRVGFELVQKAAMAGVPVLCAVSAPSSLAVGAAEQLGVTVVGFVRDGRCNVYSQAERVTVGA